MTREPTLSEAEGPSLKAKVRNPNAVSYHIQLPIPTLRSGYNEINPDETTYRSVFVCTPCARSLVRWLGEAICMRAKRRPRPSPAARPTPKLRHPKRRPPKRPIRQVRPGPFRLPRHKLRRLHLAIQVSRNPTNLLRRFPSRSTKCVSCSPSPTGTAITSRI